MTSKTKSILFLVLSFFSGFLSISFLAIQYWDLNSEMMIRRYLSSPHKNEKRETPKEEILEKEPEKTEKRENPEAIVANIRTLWKPENARMETETETEKTEYYEQENPKQEIPKKEEYEKIAEENEKNVAAQSPSLDSFGSTTEAERTKIKERFPKKDQKTDAEKADEIYEKIMKYTDGKGQRNTLQKEIKSLPPSIESLGILNELTKILPESLQDDVRYFRENLITEAKK